MTELHKETEAIPTVYPVVNVTSDISLDAIWPRLEMWCNVRWSPREVIWVIEGPVEWVPPLTPYDNLRVEIWQSGAWVNVTPEPSPFGGYCLTKSGPYRVTATVGAGPVPPAAEEAIKRLVAYLEDDSAPAGITEYRVDMAETIEEEIHRSPTHMARSLQNSGAADLLKPWKRRK